jgi:transcriptional regulator MraZ
MPDAPLLLGAIDLVVGRDALRLPDSFLRPFIDGGVLTIWLDGCVALWPHASWASIAARIATLPIGIADARAFGRLVFASAVPFGASSIVVPEPLRRAADLDGPAVLVGAGDRAELWSTGRWASMAGRPLSELAVPLA